MKITILTLFPENFDILFQNAMIQRAQEKGILELECVQIRDYSTNKHHHVDDTPFGGGAGMVMMCQPIKDCIRDVRKENSYVIYASPQGTPYNQALAHTLSEKEHLVILCGHYEGIDERIFSDIDQEISIGDYVLSGGELPAMVIVDSVVRLIDGAIKKESTIEESFENGLLEYPQYTQPANYEGEEVPEVLVSGNHQKIKEWRIYQSLKRTEKKRPDLYEKHELTEEEKKVLRKYEEE